METICSTAALSPMRVNSPKPITRAIGSELVSNGSDGIKPEILPVSNHKKT
jgi:hypothetical protein